MIGAPAGMQRPRQVRAIAVTGTRADFGLWRPVLAAAAERPDEIGLSLLVTGMHLDPRFGFTAAEVRASGAPIAAEVPFTAVEDSPEAMAASLGAAVSGMAPILAELRPDWLCLLGDRGEQLAAALGALHLGLPIAHLHGGERTLGAVDDALRDMISRAADLHLVANRPAADRLGRMGEEPWRIHVVGAPGLDGIAGCLPASSDLREAYGLPRAGDYLLVVLHPETAGGADPLADLEAVLEAVRASGLPALAIGPNADAGGRAMLDRLAAGPSGPTAFRTTVPREAYLALLAGAAALVGNSSSGLIEAPLLRTPAVNVGDRQAGRTRGDNVVDVPAVAGAISDAVARVTSPAFRSGLSGISPYGDGRAAPRIVEAIVAQPVDRRLLVKQVAP